MRIKSVWLVVLLTGCASQQQSGPVAGRDVQCLSDQVRNPVANFQNAIAACNAGTPDLTGSSNLQQMALAAHVPFTIRPKADAALKGYQASLLTGSIIPEPAAINANNPEYVPFPGIVVASGNR